MRRLFIAIELGDACRRELVRVRRSLSAFDNAVRWTAIEQLHLTLKFLGELPDERLTEACQRLDSACEGAAPLTVALNGAGCFPPRGGVRVVWVGITGDVESLTRLHGSIEMQFEAIGFPRERRAYTPHVTIGRVRSGKNAVSLREAIGRVNVVPAVQTVESIALMESKLSAAGAIHTRLHHRRLGGTVNK